MSSASEGSGSAGAAALLRVRNLNVWFDTEQGRLHAVRDVSLTLERGRTLGLVGESGCGKSVTCHAILRLLAANAAMSGEVLFAGKDLARCDEGELLSVRGQAIAMIFQEPLSALNPVHTIGGQIAESLRLHRGMNRAAAHAEALRLFDRVGIPEAKRRAREYPHQLSGGMNQRAMIAMALACQPEILIADEPTTALDVTIQAQILELLKLLQRELHMALILVTHDLGVIAETADDVAVMYAGSIVEHAAVIDLFRQPKHPYTAGLLNAIPRIDDELLDLSPIEGNVPSPLALPAGCTFAPRCSQARERCQRSAPALAAIDAHHHCACHYPLAGAEAAA